MQHKRRIIATDPKVAPLETLPRRSATPAFVADDGGVRTQLKRQELGRGDADSKLREDFLQKLVHDYPDVIPMEDISYEPSSGNVFADMGFSAAEAEELTIKSTLIATIASTMRARKLTQKAAATLCGTDQPTLSKVLRARMESVTIDRLAAWLTALGRTVEIRIRPYDRTAVTGHMVMAP